MNKVRWTTVSVALLALVATVDYLTTRDLQFSSFYFIPIALLAWKAGMELGFAAAVVAAVVWWVVEIITAQSFRTPWLAGANFAVRLSAFVVIAVTIARLRRARDRERELNARLEASVQKLEASMAEINQLRGEMQLVCAWTNRIQSEGKWVPMDKFLADKLHLRISHGISEEGMQKFFPAGSARSSSDPGATDAQPETNSH